MSPAGPADDAAPLVALGTVAPAAGEEAPSDARWLGVAAVTIVANAPLVLGSVAPRLAALAGRSSGRQVRRPAR